MLALTMRMVSGSGDDRGGSNDGIADAMVNSTEDDRFIIEFPPPLTKVGTQNAGVGTVTGSNLDHPKPVPTIAGLLRLMQG